MRQAERLCKSGEDAAFIEQWEKQADYIAKNPQLQERLIWCTFRHHNRRLFEYLIAKTPQICSQPREYPLTYPLLDTSDKRVPFFLERLLAYNAKPYGFETALSRLYQGDIGGHAHPDTARAVFSNVLFYHYHLGWNNSPYQAKAEREWATILAEHPIAEHYMNGRLTPLPATCSDEELIFTIDNLFLPLDELKYLFSDIDRNRIITDRGEAPLPYAERMQNWLFVELFQAEK